MLMVKGVLRALAQTAVLAAMLLIPASTWDWPRAIQFLVVFGLAQLTALLQNAFAAPVVTNQSQRGQVLIDSGLFGFVRHPLYLGALLFFLGIALWLESYAGVLALPLGFAPLVARMFVEERTLRATLPGYSDYMQRVPYRLVPYLW
jgi:protein-S-isoprenylcysteine O-methyltransferase Ste14